MSAFFKLLFVVAVTAIASALMLAQAVSNQHGHMREGKKTDPPIFDAIRADNIAKVKAIVAADPTAVNATGANNESALSIASSTAVLRARQTIVIHGTGLTSGVAEQQSAAKLSPVEEFLLSMGANVDARDNDGYTELMVAVMSGDRPLVKALLGRGASVNATNKDGDTALTLAALGGDLVPGNLDVFKTLVECGAKLEAKNGDGESAIHIAAGRGFADIVRYLILKGVDVNQRNAKGQTPLRLANLGKAYAVARLLRNSGGVE